MRKNFIFIRSLGFGLCLQLIACGGEKADLEKAKFLLARGSEANVAEAIAILEPYLVSANGSTQLTVAGLYAGAKMQQAGVDPIQVVAAAVYNKRESDAGSDGRKDTVALLRKAFPRLATTDDAVAKAALDLARRTLETVIADADFSSASARVQQGLRFQLGLAHFFQAMRITLKTSGLLDDDFNEADCESNLLSSGELGNQPNGLSNSLGTSRTELLAASLDATNPLVELVSDLRSDVDPDLDGTSEASEVCYYLEEQRGANQ